MDAILLDTTDDGLRTFAVVFRTDDEFPDQMQAWLEESGVSSGSFTAIGACRSMTLGYFDFETRDYRRIPIDEQVEVLTLAGNVAMGSNGSPKIHAHVSVGLRDGTARGGHLLDARVQPTLEVVLVESPAHLVRVIDEKTGLALLDLDR
jgi:predicted DNA-binding protein with PD1-like motif